MNRRHLLITTMMALAALVLGACGGDGATAPADTDETAATGETAGGDETAGGGEGEGGRITFVAAEYSAGVEPYWQDLIAEFEEANPGHEVELQVINWNDIDQQVATLIATGQQPDLLNLNKFAEYAQDDLLYEAEEVLSEEVLDDLLPTFAENATLDGTQYGIPFIASARLFFYNTALFSEAGVSEPPETWEELRAAAEQIQGLGDGTIGYGLPLGPEEAQAEFQMWINGNGGHWVDDAGEWTIDSPENVETLQWLADNLVEPGLTQPNPASTNRTDLFNVFAQGQVGMLNGAVFLPGIIEEQNPDLEYGIASIPAAEGQEPSTLGVQDYLMAFRNEGNQETLRRFLELFYSEEHYSTFITQEGFLPVTQSSSDALAGDEALQPFIEALPTARFYPTTKPAWSTVDGLVKQTVGTAVQDADPQEVLGRIQQEAIAASE
jgi:multiple sugar transport system substrate-binding protein